MDASVRAHLGSLFVGWFFDVDDRSRAIDFNVDSPARAWPLRIRDVAQPDVQERLKRVVGRDGASIWSGINLAVERFRHYECVVLALPAWKTALDPLLIDASHRACAVYLLDPGHVELDTILLPPCLSAPDIRAIALHASAQGA